MFHAAKISQFTFYSTSCVELCLIDNIYKPKVTCLSRSKSDNPHYFYVKFKTSPDQYFTDVQE